ncbi:protein kinase domain-containing protein [Actinoplanes sp. URMC 104]|uniref:serine/threonine-protein kinase n=1 Tax=Actinoplanes sp. URMC 104 TaxID=3423409 RepID=UPI003F195ADB
MLLPRRGAVHAGAGTAIGEVAVQVLAGRYGLGDALGQGGSAVVHYGFDTTLKRAVAIKIFGESATDVLLEARTAAGLSHPNIAQVYDYGEVADGPRRTPYLVMEFVDGETLADRLARTGRLKWREAAEIGAGVAAALAAAHAQSLVHRDVNPRNVMLTADGVKVLDFGIAAAAGRNGLDTNGGLWGSPTHLAPEQLRGEPTYPAADVYALGLLLFECLTGAPAWQGASLHEVLVARHGSPAPRLPRIAGLPRELVRLYEECTADDPQARPSATAVAEALRQAVRPAPLPRPARPMPAFRVASLIPATHRPQRRTTVMTSVAVVAAVLSILGAQLANGTATPGGRKAEAAVEGAVEGTRPVTVSPRPSGTPSSTPTARVRRTTETTTIRVRKKTTTRHTAPAADPTTTPAPRPSTTPPAAPSKPPASTPPPQQPTPSKTPDHSPAPTDPPVEPTDPGPSSPPEQTPPVTSSPTAESRTDQAV